MINNQYNRAIGAQPQQLLSSQQNVFISENTNLMHNTPQLNEALYFHQQPQLNMSSINQIHSSHYQNPHSLMASIGGIQQNPVNQGGTTIFDPRLARAYANTNSIPPTTNSNANMVNNTSSSNMPSQSNTILIDSFAPHIQADQSQHVFRNSTQISQHFSPALQLQHSNVARQVQRTSERTQPPHNFEHTDIASTSNSSQIMQLQIPSANQPIFLSADAFGNAANGKMSAYFPFKVNSSFPASINEMYQRELQTTTNAAIMPNSAVANATSPVVLDRINICINNHYTDPNFSSSIIDTGVTNANSAAETPSLSSPIIPPIQHNAVIDPNLLIEPAMNSSEINTTTNAITAVPLTVNEPDSTTTSHTPPLTPDNTSNLVASVNAIQSPSTSSTAKVDEHFKDYRSSNTKINDDDLLFGSNEISTKPSENLNEPTAETEETLSDIAQEALITPTIDLVTEKMFAIGDDVFVKIDNDHLYLGTIIDSKYQRYRVRFDDASEMWCSPKEMRKFGVCDESNTSSGNGEKGLDDSDSGSLCVACKKRDLIDVEICQRCGRGYHKACTTETSPGSGEWNCKRCSKSMKLDQSEINCDEYENCVTMKEQRRQFPYDVETLHWDNKHRVNEEQIYCYCGKSGQFDYNMLQCCKCHNWYHTTCIQNFKGPMLRGDGFFIFCCAVCSNNGIEFLRRLQMSSVDFMHLVLYHLSTQRKHQHHKYHHLTKDIWPFVLSQRQTSALPEEWFGLTEDELKDCVLSTLKNNIERFICGRELKRDYYFYGLRHNGPPPSALPKNCNIEEISDEFITESLMLKLSKRAIENCELPAAVQPVLTVLELNSDKDDTDGKFTSDDEIPIKLILEKEKVKNKTSNDTDKHEKQKENLTLDQQSEKKLITKAEIRSHKRKAFKLSRPYKESTADKKSCTNINNCESSSDENSSSSRGTSLDLIIPPPKDFLGANNPFRTVASPKKGTGDKKLPTYGRSISGVPTVRNSVVNASGLDFCSNLAALKNAGVLPNLNTTNFARAAGQPRMVRTIKRRLSAKDIMIGPNQEIRRRRTRRLSSNVEVISTTTINPISSFFPINVSSSTKTAPTILRKHNFSTALPSLATTMQISATKTEKQRIVTINKQTATHGRRLRLRPQNSLPTNSRRSSLSGASTSSTSSSSGNATPQTAQYSESVILNDLQQTVNRYFGVGHLIATGEQFSIHAKRQLPNGQIQLLIEWGVNDENSVNTDSTIATDTGEKTISQENS